MKPLCLFIVLLCILVSASAGSGPVIDNKKVETSKGSLQLTFHKNLPKEISKDLPNAHKDSVLIILDRFDLTGAGVIYKVFYENENNCITIPDIPRGKYYVTVQCLGIHRDRVETVVKIKSQNIETLKINQADAEEFSKNNVIIPPFQPDFQNLAIVKAK
jgi:hypothetical protein